MRGANKARLWLVKLNVKLTEDDVTLLGGYALMRQPQKCVEKFQLKF